MAEEPLNFFIDECLSPQLARRVNQSGRHVAHHARDLSRLRDPDHVVLQRCIEDDRVIVTENAIDFRKLVGKVELHPGLIILPSVNRERSWMLLDAAISFLEEQGDPANAMVNHVLEVSEAGEFLLLSCP